MRSLDTRMHLYRDAMEVCSMLCTVKTEVRTDDAASLAEETSR